MMFFQFLKPTKKKEDEIVCAEADAYILRHRLNKSDDESSRRTGQHYATRTEIDVHQLALLKNDTTEDIGRDVDDV